MSNPYDTPIYKTFTEYEKDLFEERAGIRQYDGEEEKWQAENAALRDILQIRWDEQSGR
jgi:hypothetical protein